MMEPMSISEATEFFSDFYFGKHHIPHPIRRDGFGWSVYDRRGLATYDFNHLTRLVVMAHDRCIRAEILPAGPRGIRIKIDKRERGAKGMSRRHPTLDDAVAFIRGQQTTNPPAGDRRGDE